MRLVIAFFILALVPIITPYYNSCSDSDSNESFHDTHPANEPSILPLILWLSYLRGNPVVSPGPSIPGPPGPSSFVCEGQAKAIISSICSGIKGTFDAATCQCIPSASPPSTFVCEGSSKAVISSLCAGIKGTFDPATCACTPPETPPSTFVCEGQAKEIISSLCTGIKGTFDPATCACTPASSGPTTPFVCAGETKDLLSALCDEIDGTFDDTKCECTPPVIEPPPPPPVCDDISKSILRVECAKIEGALFNEENCECAPPFVCDDASRPGAAEACAQVNGAFDSNTCECTPPPDECDDLNRPTLEADCNAIPGATFNTDTCLCTQPPKPKNCPNCIMGLKNSEKTPTYQEWKIINLTVKKNAPTDGTCPGMRVKRIFDGSLLNVPNVCCCEDINNPQYPNNPPTGLPE